ncbi:flavoprotein [Cuniculiplasma sp. SKW4]|uniref:flavoprotein n=1 Tax=Cuniculiplasma sp. SKW4 TaxID=3400171 RepID=UPI003FCFB316
MHATANIVGKAAHGICDDLISTSIVSCQAPIVFVPSMNEIMWRNKVVQENISKIRSQGHYLIEPTTGYEVSSMAKSYGAMPPIRQIIEYLINVLASKK